MAEKKRIRVPTFMDDPVVGRFISAIPFTCRFICPPLDLFSDHIVIDGDNLVFKRSKTSYQGDKTYYLKNIAKLLVRKGKHPVGRKIIQLICSVSLELKSSLILLTSMGPPMCSYRSLTWAWKGEEHNGIGSDFYLNCVNFPVFRLNRKISQKGMSN